MEDESELSIDWDLLVWECPHIAIEQKNIVAKNNFIKFILSCKYQKLCQRKKLAIIFTKKMEGLGLKFGDSDIVGIFALLKN